MPHCEYCGKPMPAGGNFCASCGRLSRPVEEQPTAAFRTAQVESVVGMSLFAGDAAGAVYAGFWRRALAYLLDQLVLFAGLAAILFFIGLAYGVSIAFLGSKDMND